ncbi:hypothetical protein [Deinococcus soli (ex Cha et al. 2016)]|uniref:Uncharacterized protein n=1 Tax=Deinococcus soli (ex Cha et al. 2016) TaxID=1309411 RepID=A0ACC6KPB7_9DEIO|nr:hypothetical protein [Deinococcus soli (ex Cha et al. 2016)]MDR6330564.1 hypothetical protein [Deinococcus soli (ex Cha et al. 2016)]MDR6754341.1 hypothetical protein [Deinococcus soli (ex Cha et al. 2016)]GGB84900.1 hypothetical protein GCM10008019_46100 [Deinococcus soli (ex Cha et al. 2016)]
MTRTFLPLLLALTTTALAGGVEPINRSQPLHWVPGVLTITTGRTGTQPFTNAITLTVGGQRVQVYLITGSRSDDTTLSAINTLTAWVTTPTATPTQKQALTEVARAYLRGCNVQATPAQLALLNTLDRWEDGGWHEKTLDGVTVGWADGNGFGFRDEAERLKHRTGLSLQWPLQASRCQF